MRPSDRDLLGPAARALRDEPTAGRLSRAARAAIVERATAPRSDLGGEISPLFVPVRRLAWLGLVPAILVAVLIATHPTAPERGASTAPRLEAAKQGDRVVFTIANGGRAHTVTRSDVPYRFDESSAVRVRDHTFQDSTDRGPALVFYKID